MKTDELVQKLVNVVDKCIHDDGLTYRNGKYEKYEFTQFGLASIEEMCAKDFTEILRKGKRS